MQQNVRYFKINVQETKEFLFLQHVCLQTFLVTVRLLRSCSGGDDPNDVCQNSQNQSSNELHATWNIYRGRGNLFGNCKSDSILLTS